MELDKITHPAQYDNSIGRGPVEVRPGGMRPPALAMEGKRLSPGRVLTMDKVQSRPGEDFRAVIAKTDPEIKGHCLRICSEYADKGRQ